MIAVAFNDADAEAGDLVISALRRSFTASGVKRIRSHDEIESCLVVVNPSDSQSDAAATVAANGGKVLLLGTLDQKAASVAGVETERLPVWTAGLDDCAPASPHNGSESEAVIMYGDHPLAMASPFSRRPLLRYDFNDEWNNLGYGRIGFGDSNWDIAQGAGVVSACVLANVVAGPGKIPYFTAQENEGVVLWCNRPCGPIDSYEWAIVEDFFASYRHNDLPCVPALREAPYGSALTISIRLDCDEAISSARSLFELYGDRGVPLSLAVKTSLVIGDDEKRLMGDIVAAGGAILSHSVNHYPRWGGDPSTCRNEAIESKRILEHHLPGYSIEGAVSPFHQTPSFALKELEDAGYLGVIGGAISAEPCHVMARGGTLGSVDKLVFHTQQCMLHGDCLLETGDPLAVYRNAVDAAIKAAAVLGCLDHPFSERYSYGWSSEDQRIAHHADFLDYAESASAAGGGPLFLNQNDCLRHIRRRSLCRLCLDGDNLLFEDPAGGCQELAIIWRGEILPVGARA